MAYTPHDMTHHSKFSVPNFLLNFKREDGWFQASVMSHWRELEGDVTGKRIGVVCITCNIIMEWMYYLQQKVWSCMYYLQYFYGNGTFLWIGLLIMVLMSRNSLPQDRCNHLICCWVGLGFRIRPKWVISPNTCLDCLYVELYFGVCLLVIRII